jgi:hypothetical protein
MPRVPLLKEGPVRRTPTPDIGIAGAEQRALGAGISTLTKQASEFAFALDRSKKAADLSSALAFSAAARTQEVEDIQKDFINYADADKRLAKKDKAINAEVKKKFPDIFNQWEIDDAAHREKAGIDTRTWQSKREIDRQESELVINEKVWFNDAVRATDNISLGIASGQYFDSLERAVASGAITAEDFAIKKLDFARRVQSARADKAISENPVVAKERIEAGEFALDEDVRLTKLARADVAIEAELRQETQANEKAEKEEAENKKKLQEGRAVEWTVANAEGQPIDQQELIDDLAAGNITRSFFDSFVKETPLETSDPDELLEIDVRVTNNQISQSEILANPLLSSTDKARQSQRLVAIQDKALQRDVKDGRDELRALIISTGPAAAFLKQDEQEKLQQAYNEYEQRLADGEDKLKILEDMKPRFRSTPAKLRSLPMPALSPAPATKADAVASQKALVLGLQNGRYTDIKQAEREAELLESYINIFDDIEVSK